MATKGIVKFLFIAFLEFVLGYSKARTAATKQFLDLCVCPL